MEIKRLVSSSPPPVVISHHSIIDKSQYITHTLSSIQVQVPTPTTPDYNSSTMTEPGLVASDTDIRGPDNESIKIEILDQDPPFNQTPDSGVADNRVSSRAHSPDKGHKRMLSTITEDRNIKKSGVMSMSDIVNAMPDSESDEKTSEKPAVIEPVKSEKPPLVMLDSPTISSSSVSSRRHAHILSEQRRRENINGGFQVLKNAVPFCKGTQDSKATILRKAAEYIMTLEHELNQLKYHDGMVQTHVQTAGLQTYATAGLPPMPEHRYVYAHPVQTIHGTSFMAGAHGAHGAVAVSNPSSVGASSTSLPPPSSLHSSPTSAHRSLPFPPPLHSLKPLVAGPSIGNGITRANSVPFTISRPASTPPSNSQFRYRFNSN